MLVFFAILSLGMYITEEVRQCLCGLVSLENKGECVARQAVL